MQSEIRIIKGDADGKRNGLAANVIEMTVQHVERETAKAAKRWVAGREERKHSLHTAAFSLILSPGFE